MSSKLWVASDTITLLFNIRESGFERLLFEKYFEFESVFYDAVV